MATHAPQEYIGRSRGNVGFRHEVLLLEEADSERSTCERLFSPLESGSIRGSVFTLACTCIGAGILSLPLVLRNCGLGLGMGLMVLGCLLSIYTLNLLATVGFQYNVASFDHICKIVGGSGLERSLHVFMILFSFGTCVAYLQISGNYATSAMVSFGLDKSHLLTRPWFIIAGIGAPVVLLLSQRRDLSALNYVSLFATVIVVFLTVIVVLRSVQHAAVFHQTEIHNGVYNSTGGYSSDENFVYFKIDWNFPAMFSTIVFAYNCHVNLYSVYGELVNPLERRMGKVINRALALCGLLYGLVALFGYLLFTGRVMDNVVDNFPMDDPLFIVARVAVVVKLCCTCPLSVNPGLRLLEIVLWGKGCANGGCGNVFEQPAAAASGDSLPDALRYGLVDADASGSGGTTIKNLQAMEEPDDDGDDNGCLGFNCLTYQPQFRWFLLTLFMVGAPAVLAIVVPDLNTVISLIGATSCTYLDYILPVYLYIYHSNEKVSASFPKAGSLVVAVMVTCLSVVSIVQTLIKLL